MLPMVVSVAVAVGGGCGGSTSSQTATPAATAHAAATTAAHAPPGESPAQISRDRAIGSLALLRLSDFPTGWTSQPRQSKSSTEPQLDESVARCMGVNPAALKARSSAEVESPKFSEGQKEATNQVAVEPSIVAAQKRLARFQLPQAPSCLQSAISAAVEYRLHHAREKLPSGVSIGSPTVAQMSFPRIGDQGVAYRVTIMLKSTANVTFYIDLVAFRKGRVYVSMSFRDILSPFNGAEEERLTKLTVHRLHT